MHRTRALALLTGVAALATLALTTAASAGISGARVITDNGEAGYYAVENQPGHFTKVTMHFYVRKAFESIGPAGTGVGVQLGNDTTGNAVQAGGVWNDSACPGMAEIGFGSGSLAGLRDTDGTNTTDLNSGGVLPVLHLSPILCVPQGHSALVILKEVSKGLYEVFGKDLTTGLSASKGFTGLAYPDEAGAGPVQDLTNRSAPANITLVKFRGLDLCDSNGVCGDLGGTSEWTAVQVISNASGNSANPALVDPKGSLSGDSFTVWVGAQTGP